MCRRSFIGSKGMSGSSSSFSSAEPSFVPEKSNVNENSDDETSSDDTVPQLLCINFTRNAELATGGDYGCTIYKTHENETPFIIYEMSKKPTLKKYTAFVHDVHLIECFLPMYKFAVVFGSSPRKLYFYDAVQRIGTGANHFPERILSIKSCSSVIAVGLENEIQCFCIYHHKFDNLKYYLRLINLPSPLNFSSLMDLTGEERPHIAYPDSATSGIVAYHDICSHSHAKKLMNAHNHPIGALRFNDDATMLATASNIGTVIRVHAVRKNQCIFVFRRGIARSVMIHSMAFSTDSRFLCVSSDTETVHVYKLEGTLPKLLFLEEELVERYREKSKPPSKPGLYDYLAHASRSAAEYLAPQRDFVLATLPETGNLNVAALKRFDEQLFLFVAISTRKFFSYLIDPKNGTAELKNNGGKLVSNVTK